MTKRSLSQSILLATLLLCRLRGQTAVDGNQIHLTAQSHTATNYAVVPADCGKLLSFSASSAISITIPPSTVTALATGCWIDFQNTGPAVAAIAPSGVTIDGLSGVQLGVGEGLHLVFTGSAFLSVRGGGGVWTNSVTGTGVTPVFSASGTSGVTFLYTLTADTSSSTFTGPAAGVYIFAITQDGTGGHFFSWPPNVTNAPAVDPGATDTTYLLCQFDGTNCVGLGNFATGANAIPGITIPGFTSGSNTIVPPAAAGSGSQTNLAPNGTTVIPNSCAGQVVQSIAANGVIACGAAGGGGGGSGGQSLTTQISIDLGPLATQDGYLNGPSPIWSLAQDTAGGNNVPLGQTAGFAIAVWQYSAANFSAISRSFFIPADVDLSANVTVTLEAAPDAAGASGNFGWTAKLACAPSSLVSWPWNPTASTGAYSASATQYAVQENTTAALTMTGCTAGALARIAVARDHTVASDSSATADLFAVKLNYSRM